MPRSSWLLIVFLWVGLCAAGMTFAPGLAAADESAAESTNQDDAKPAFDTELIHGRFVWMAEALKSEFGVSTVPEIAENTLAILTKDGELLPIVENLRARAFRKDQRLRDMDLAILARRYRAQPFIQVLRIYEVEGDQRYEVDYWCDVCAIIMFEDGPCACCQDHNRIRKRIVDKDGETTREEKED